MQFGSNFAANQLALDATTVYGGIAAPDLSLCTSGARIASTPRTPGPVTTLVPCGTIAGEGANTYSLLVANSVLYWSELQDSNDATPSEMHHVPLAGGVIADVGVAQFAIQPAADATSVYVNNGALSAIHPDGSNLVALDNRAPLYIALDDTTVYYAYEPCFFSDEDEGCTTEASILSIPKAGGAATTLVDDVPSVMNLTVRGSYLYWIQGEGNRSTVRRLPTAGGQTETLVTDDRILWYAVGDTDLFWERDGVTTFSEAYEVMTAPLASPASATLLLHQDNDHMLSMTSDDTVVIWSSAWGKLWVLAK